MAQRLKIIFAGTPAFAAAALTAIHAEGFEVPLVLTQPDRPAGRGMKYMASPVKQYALEAGLALIQPPSLRTGGQCAEHALAAGDTETGISLMQMDAGLDTGPVLCRTAIPIHATDTAATLTQTLTVLGAQQIVNALKTLQKNGVLPKILQPAEGGCYAPKISKEEAAIDWRRPADTLARQIRAFDPVPGVHTLWADMPIKLWAAESHCA